MIKPPQKNFHFVFNWKISLFSAICLSVFVALGFWQLDRAEEKRELQARLKQASLVLPRPASELPESGQLNGLAVILQGHFDADAVLLLDNRVLDGVVGFEVLQVFHDAATRIRFLVNRGFVPMGRTREDLPIIPAIVEKIVVPTVSTIDSTSNPQPPGPGVNIVVRIYQPAERQYMLRDESPKLGKYAVIVQSPPMVELAAYLRTHYKAETYPHVVRLNAGEIGALPRYWPATSMPPEMHQGYAWQWFTMALAVSLAWLFFSFRRQDV